jgi:hypothetical protein
MAQESRDVEFRFVIPFGGEAAETCEGVIRDAVTHHLLNSLSVIHPSITCEIAGVERTDGSFAHWQQRWDDAQGRWIDFYVDGRERGVR